MTTAALRRSQVTDAHWAARVDLAAAFRLVDLFGWSDLLGTHLSAHIPFAPDLLRVFVRKRLDRHGRS